MIQEPIQEGICFEKRYSVNKDGILVYSLKFIKGFENAREYEVYGVFEDRGFSCLNCSTKNENVLHILIDNCYRAFEKI